MIYYIYQLFGIHNENKNKNKNKRYHYIGSTPRPQYRIRQHNGDITGGAKYTTNKLNILEQDKITNLKWNYNWLMITFFNKNLALSLEWHLRHYLKNIKNKNKNNLFEKMDEIILNFINKKNNKRHIIILIDYDIDYKPKNYKIIKSTLLTYSILNNNLIEFMSVL